MASRLKRAGFVRAAVAAACCLVPLALTGAAQAAITGANHPTTTDQMDLVSAQILSASPAEVQYCFDKLVDQSATGFVVANNSQAKFYLNGYAAGNTVQTLGTANAINAATNPSTVDPANNKCVDIFWPSTIGDIDMYSIASVQAGAVNFAATGKKNLDDSTALLPPLDNHNGTTGLTIAPDLTNIPTPTATEQGNNALEFHFDQSLAVVPAAGSFWIWTPGGTSCSAGAGSAAFVPGTSNRVVLATFTGCSSVTSAIEGEVLPNSLVSANDAAAGASNPTETQFITGGPNNDTFVNNPQVTKTALDPLNANAIDYFFNIPVQITGNSVNFQAVLSTGKVITATGNNQLSSTEVQATFTGANDLASKNEYAVEATIIGCGSNSVIANCPQGGTFGLTGGVKQAASPNALNADQTVNVGDNAGAFANGFTTAPDVTNVTQNPPNQWTVSLDQRTCVVGVPTNPCTDAPGPVNITHICQQPSFGYAGAYTAGNGCATNAVAVQPSAFGVNNPGQLAGPQTVTLTFGGTGATPVTQNAYLLFEGCTESGGATGAFQAPLQNGNTANGVCDRWSVSQQVAPVSSGAILRAIRANNAVVARKHHKHHKNHRNHKH